MIVTIPCKPYVRHFLTINYGDPVSFAKAQDLYSELRSRLSKQTKHCESRALSERLYNQKVEIIISEDDFYRYGWELTRTDIRRFNRMIEYRIKMFMRISISNYELLHSQKEAIKLFQQKFGFSEDIWPYESIKKDYFRNNNMPSIKIKDIINAEIEKKLLVHLSDLGIIDLTNIQTYENNF
ncbi:MAG: hypothetical protein AB7C90_02455 [Bacteroidales bacterium]